MMSSLSSFRHPIGELINSGSSNSFFINNNNSSNNTILGPSRVQKSSLSPTLSLSSAHNLASSTLSSAASSPSTSDCSTDPVINLVNDSSSSTSSQTVPCLAVALTSLQSSSKAKESSVTTDQDSFANEIQTEEQSKFNIPYSWKREQINGQIVYISPSNVHLWSIHDISAYLLTEGTCKCGLECPVILNDVFNFDPRVPSISQKPRKNNDNNHLFVELLPRRVCNHKRRNSYALFSHHNPTDSNNIFNDTHNQSKYDNNITSNNTLIHPVQQQQTQIQQTTNPLSISQPNYPDHQAHVVFARHNLDQHQHQTAASINSLPIYTRNTSQSIDNSNITAGSDVISGMSLTPSLLSPNNPGPGQLLQIYNPVPYTPVPPNTVTVLQATQNGDGATILIPQLMQSDQHQSVILNSAGTGLDQASLLPQIRTTPATFSSIPLHSPYAAFQANSYSPNLPSTQQNNSHNNNDSNNNIRNNVNDEINSKLIGKFKLSKTRKKRETRNSRHQMTVAAYLSKKEENVLSSEDYQNQLVNNGRKYDDEIVQFQDNENNQTGSEGDENVEELSMDYEITEKSESTDESYLLNVCANERVGKNAQYTSNVIVRDYSNHSETIRNVGVQSELTDESGSPVKENDETMSPDTTNVEESQIDNYTQMDESRDNLEANKSEKDIDETTSELIPDDLNDYKVNDDQNNSTDYHAEKSPLLIEMSTVNNSSNLTEASRPVVVSEGLYERLTKTSEEGIKDRNSKKLERLKKELCCYDNAFDASPAQSPPLSPQPRTFETGDLVWGQMKGNPSWPGKLVNGEDVPGYNGQTDKGKVWVKWFGDNLFTQVEPEKLKTLSEGLEAHHTARKKHRKGKKTDSSLDQAIQEAMMELDKQNNQPSPQPLSSTVIMSAHVSKSPTSNKSLS